MRLSVFNNPEDQIKAFDEKLALAVQALEASSLKKVRRQTRLKQWLIKKFPGQQFVEPGTSCLISQIAEKLYYVHFMEMRDKGETRPKCKRLEGAYHALFTRLGTDFFGGKICIGRDSLKNINEPAADSDIEEEIVSSAMSEFYRCTDLRKRDEVHLLGEGWVVNFNPHNKPIQILAVPNVVFETPFPGYRLQFLEEGFIERCMDYCSYRCQRLSEE